MSKIICEICGTSYPETAECCPICGCSQTDAEKITADETLLEENALDTVAMTGSHPRKKGIFDFDEEDSASQDEEDDEDDEEDFDEEEDEDEPRPNTFAVILLTILIACLLAAAGFIFVRYFLPNMGAEETVPTTEAVEVISTTAATEATVPCENIIMSNPSVAEMSEYGQQFLLNVQIKPDNTTDKVVFSSADESIAVVTEDGKITAISEGETVIHITCGNQKIDLPVVIKFVAEDIPTTEATIPVEENEEATNPDEETPEETKSEVAPADPDVELKLKVYDFKLGVYYYHTLQLDCELDPSQVEWSSEHPHIAKVDEKGVVTALKEGVTDIIVKYGDQEVRCKVRCGWY